MNANRYKTGFALLIGLFAAASQAADIDAGKAKSAACQGCHGSSGISSNAMWPNLAGQTAAYIEAQLSKFKTGARENPTMQPMAAGLSNADIKNLAAYYAGLPAKSAGGDAALAKTGKGLVTQCMGCHGEKLQGQGQFPKLAGQHPAYLAKQLNDFKSGSRKSGTMNAVAKNLSDDEIKAVAAYLGTLGD